VTELRHHTVAVPATSANLGPGFDAFGLALDLHLTVGTRPSGTATPRVRSHGEGADDLDAGEDNLIWRSLVAFCDEVGVPVPDVHLEVHNEVPLERGLGSSSSAIVAGLTLARALTGARVGDRDLVELADRIEGHPDNVAPALLGGLVACAPGADGRLVVRRINPAPTLRVWALVPTHRQATAAARGVLPSELPRSDVVAQASRAGHVLAGLVGAWPIDPQAAVDLLHEPSRLKVMEPSGRVIEALRAAGAHAWLSGAGPTVAATVPSGEASVIEQLHGIAEEADFVVRACAPQLAGAVACPEGGCAFAGVPGCVQCPRRRV
jgi:homoserine kinase